MCLRQEKSLGSWQITNQTTAKHHDLLCKITTLNIFIIMNLKLISRE